MGLDEASCDTGAVGRGRFHSVLRRRDVSPLRTSGFDGFSPGPVRHDFDDRELSGKQTHECGSVVHGGSVYRRRVAPAAHQSGKYVVELLPERGADRPESGSSDPELDEGTEIA